MSFASTSMTTLDSFPIVQPTTVLRRTSRTRTRKTAPKSCPSAGFQLNTIQENDSAADTDSSPTPSRRRAVLSLPPFTLEQSVLLCGPPRPAPRPPTATYSSPESTPASSPDSFHLSFSDLALDFPHPPSAHLPSPPSDYTSSPANSTMDLPPTPTSDDEFFRSPVIQSQCLSPIARELVLCEMSLSPAKGTAVPLVSSTSLAHAKSIRPLVISKNLSKTPAGGSTLVAADEDAAWYANEFSDLLTLYSPQPPSFPAARPESMQRPVSTIIVDDETLQVDPSLPKRKRSLPKRAPPPPINAASLHPSHALGFATSPAFSSPRSFLSARSTSPLNSSTSSRFGPRPSPRVAVPVDLDEIEQQDWENLTEEVVSPMTSSSRYSQGEFPTDIFENDVDDDTKSIDIPAILIDTVVEDEHQLVMPVLSPIQLERDFEQGLKELWSIDAAGQNIQAQMEQVAEVESSASEDSHVSHATARSKASTNSSHAERDRILRSRWSSSTLGSLREESKNASAMKTPARLMAYFSKKSKSPKSSSPSKTPTAANSPSAFAGFARKMPSSPSSSFESPVIRRPSSRESVDRPSMDGRPASRTSTSSYASSDCGSTESSCSSPRQRKPIPVAMFLRSS